MRRTVFSILFAALLLAPAWPASAADPEYPPKVPTSCQVSVPSAVVGERVVIRVNVTASTNVALTGSVDVSITRSGARPVRAARAAADWTTTVRYEGEPLRIVGPRLSRGEHVARIVFTPDSSAFAGCRDSLQFGVGATGDVGGEDDGAGLLPDTGGPHLGLLIAGLGMVGAGSVLVARRRERVTPGTA